MNPRRGSAALIVIAIIVAALALLAAWYFGHRGLSGGGPMPSYAPSGQPASQFPQSLIFDPTISLTQSYAIHYSTSTNQYTASWNSSSSPDDVIAAYKNYFRTQGWHVSPNPVTQASIRGLSASTSSAYVLVTAITKDTGSAVTVSYVQK